MEWRVKLNLTVKTLEYAGVYIVTIGDTSFHCYIELARLLGNEVASLRDNEVEYDQNSVERFTDMSRQERRVYRDEDVLRSCSRNVSTEITLNCENGYSPVYFVCGASMHILSRIRPMLLFVCSSIGP